MKLNFQWKELTGQFAEGEALYLNRILVATAGYNSFRSKVDTPSNSYVGKLLLPSIKNNRVYSENIDTIKQKIEQAVTNWFNEALKEA